MNHLYGVNKYTYARYCTETDLLKKKLPELDPDPEPDWDLVVKFPDPAKRFGSRSATLLIGQTTSSPNYNDDITLLI
jgi:hypothetical protein